MTESDNERRPKGDPDREPGTDLRGMPTWHSRRDPSEYLGITTWALALFLLLPAIARAADAEDYPKLTLANDAVSIDVYLPDGANRFYRGLRFDHSGMVAQARFAGHTFFGELYPTHDPAVNDHGAGTPEEFGMTLTSPLGYDQAKGGQPFLKIGVGVLEKAKDKEPYSFAGRYKVAEWPQWKVEREKSAVTFSQSAGLSGGDVSYAYAKRVELTADGFKIARTLKNTGKSKWSTDHYGHNYIIIDGRPIDPAYTLTLPFALRLEAQNDTKLADVGGKTIAALRTPPDKRALWANVSGFSGAPADNVMRVENADAKAGVEISTDAPMRRLVLYATRYAFCPESFTVVELGPGESKTWTTTYRFFETK
jgi:hypothetical protein